MKRWKATEGGGEERRAKEEEREKKRVQNEMGDAQAADERWISAVWMITNS